MTGKLHRSILKFIAPSGDPKTARRQLIINLITIAAVYVVILFMVIDTPLLCDDYHFHFVFKKIWLTKSESRLSSFSDVLTSVKNYYNNSGGRALSHFTLFLMFWLGDAIFNVLNPLMFVLAGLLPYKLITRTGAGRDCCWLLPAIYSTVFLLPDFGDNVLWRAGAVNYLWPVVYMFIALLCTERFFENPGTKKALLMCIPAAVSALTNEVTGGMEMVFIVICTVKVLGEGRATKKHLNILIPSAVILLSAYSVIAAPGNTARMKSSIGTPLSSLSDFIHNFIKYSVFFKDILLWLLLVVMISFLLVDIRKKRFGLRLLTQLLYEHRYLVTGYAGVTALSFEKEYYTRAMFLGLVVALVGCWLSAAKLFEFFRQSEGFRKYAAARLGTALALWLAILAAAGFVAFNTYLLAKNNEDFKMYQRRLCTRYENKEPEWWKPETYYLKSDRSSFQPKASCWWTAYRKNFAGWQIMYFYDENPYREMHPKSKGKTPEEGQREK